MITRRREFLVAGAALAASGVACGAEKQPAAEDVSAIEDLMREHGVLSRILLIYEEGIRQLKAKRHSPLEPTRLSAQLALTASYVRIFVEDYHEKLEENFIFPEFEKRNELVPLVKVLREQHAAGRAVTDMLLDAALAKKPRQEEIVAACYAFVRMYRPHKAREDTVVFPALHKILSAKRLDELGDKFEAEENQRLGDKGFEKMVEDVADIERLFDIYDLAQFTAYRKQEPK